MGIEEEATALNRRLAEGEARARRAEREKVERPTSYDWSVETAKVMLRYRVPMSRLVHEEVGKRKTFKATFRTKNGYGKTDGTRRFYRPVDGWEVAYLYQDDWGKREHHFALLRDGQVLRGGEAGVWVRGNLAPGPWFRSTGVTRQNVGEGLPAWEAGVGEASLGEAYKACVRLVARLHREGDLPRSTCTSKPKLSYYIAW